MKKITIIFTILFIININAQEPPTKFFGLSFFEKNIVTDQNGEFEYGEVIKSSRSKNILLFKEKHTNFQIPNLNNKALKMIYLYGSDSADYDDRLLLFKFINKKNQDVYLYVYYEPLARNNFKSTGSAIESIDIFRYGIGFDFLNTEKGTYLLDVRNLQKLFQKIIDNKKILLNQLEKKIEEQNIPYIEDKIKYFYKNVQIKSSTDSLNYYRELYERKTQIHDKWVQVFLQNKEPYMGYLETDVQLTHSFNGIRNAKDYSNVKNAISTVIGEYDVKYIIKQKLIEELKIGKKIISIEDLEKHYKNHQNTSPKVIQEILAVFEK